MRPILGTRTCGRGGFAIHGGAIPGSIGCVDLTRYMPDFVKHFREYGRDMRMLVTYDGQRKKGAPKTVTTNPSARWFWRLTLLGPSFFLLVSSVILY